MLQFVAGMMDRQVNDSLHFSRSNVGAMDANP